MSTTHKKDIQFGNEDLLSSDEFDSKYGKERISLLVDLQVVEAFKEKAEKSGEKYQVLMRKALREAIFSSPLSEFERRLERVESQVFKKA